MIAKNPERVPVTLMWHPRGDEPEKRQLFPATEPGLVLGALTMDERYHVVESDTAIEGPDGIPYQYKAGSRMALSEAERLGIVGGDKRTNQAVLVSQDVSDAEREAEIARLEIAEKPHQTLDAGNEGKSLEGEVEGANKAGSVQLAEARANAAAGRENRAADADTAKRGKGE